VVSLLKVHTELFEFVLEVFSESHIRRSDKGDRAIELTQRITEGVHRPHAHIADRQPLQPIDATLLAQHGVQVGEDLRRVLAPAVAAVDDRHARPSRGFMRRALLKVAHHDHIAIELQHLHSILDGLLIEVTGTSHLGIGKSRYMAAEAVHGGFVSQTSARRRLIKGSHQSLLFEHIHVPA
jgi:hypothetical protein